MCTLTNNAFRSKSVPWEWTGWLVLGLLILLASGCRRGPAMAPASGKVTYNGQPLKFGSVTFQPSSGQPARGEIQSDGTFSLSTYKLNDGAAIGPHKVKIACYESQRAPKPAGGGEQTLGKSLIPTNYTLFDQSGLTADVRPGNNEPFVFELKSPSGQAR